MQYSSINAIYTINLCSINLNICSYLNVMSFVTYTILFTTMDYSKGKQEFYIFGPFVF